MVDRETWKSRTGFLLAALGSAIGLGNIWRFPYMAYRNGGGAFLVPYFVALFVVGIPLLMLEFGLGHRFRSSFPRALERIHPRFSWIGWWSVSFVMFGIVVYYAVVMAWCGNYLVFSFTQPWGDAADAGTYFDEDFLGITQDGETVAVYSDSEGFYFGAPNLGVVIALAFVWFVNWLILRRKLQHGIELANKIIIPLLIGLTTILVVWSWTFPGASAGRAIYLNPDWSQAFQAQTWIDAFTQIFFTLSLAFGIMVAYASYLPTRTDIPTSAFLASMGNCAFSVFAGFAVFAGIGFLAEQRDLDVSQMKAVERELETLEQQAEQQPLTTAEQRQYEQLSFQHDRNVEFESQMSTFGLLFKTYPAIITEMGPITGRVFGILFFVSLLIAGISSAISIVESFLSSLLDYFNWSRGTTAGVLCTIAFLLGCVFCMRTGLFWLDLVDHFITTYGLVLVAIAETLVVGWIFTSRKLRHHLESYRDFRFGTAVGILMRILITLVLMLTWLGLGQIEAAPVAAGIARVGLLGCAIVLWVHEHWFDFDIRLVVPGLLVLILDQALIREFREPYGNYPYQAIVGIGLAWLLGTLVIGLGLNLLANRIRHRDSET